MNADPTSSPADPGASPSPSSAPADEPVISGPALRQPLHAIWETAALEVARTLSGDVRWSAEHDTNAAAPALPVEVAAHWELSGALRGKMQIRLHRAAARAWTQLRPGSAAAGGDSRGPIAEAEMEALAEVLRGLARAAAEELEAGGWGSVQIALRHLGPLRRTIEEGESEFPLRLRHPEQHALELGICIDSALREQIRQGPRFESDVAGQRESRHGARLDLLLDIELDVTLRFGGRQMLLHDVLDLAPGSVLELDRNIDDPVELLVGGKVIAWGEVVVVDGNYGLRISRLLRKRERIAALGVGAEMSVEAGVGA